MSLAVTATFMLADWVVKGLKDGTFERVGGVIREVGTKQVVTWLREYEPNSSVPIPSRSADNLLNLILSGANQGVLQVATAASVLNLGISIMSFAVISQRLKEIEKQLQKSQEILNKMVLRLLLW
ncbi:MAG: hypothetical protein MET45_29205 [Nostoc sp. LLA-1]|nr:hypothetical protein [Cyanocohniella sp. LLY]